MHLLHMTKGLGGLLGSTLNVALGVGAVLGGSYLFSRVCEKQDIEARLERMEQMLEKLSREEQREESRK